MQALHGHGRPPPAATYLPDGAKPAACPRPTSPRVLRPRRRSPTSLPTGSTVVFARRAARFAAFVGVIAKEEGYRLNVRKTRMAGRGSRQQVVSIVVNDRAALPRSRYDALRAVLHNCIVRGASTQNRAEHPDFRACLVGSVAAATAIDPKRGGRLAALLAQVDWSL